MSIPASVEKLEIGEYAFAWSFSDYSDYSDYCEIPTFEIQNPMSIDLYIEEGAFQYTGLRTFEIPYNSKFLFTYSDGTQEYKSGIPSHMFEGCMKLEQVKILVPDDAEGIFYFWDACFFGCSKLKSLTLPRGKKRGLNIYGEQRPGGMIYYLGDGPFDNSSLEYIEYTGSQEEWDAMTSEPTCGFWDTEKWPWSEIWKWATMVVGTDTAGK